MKLRTRIIGISCIAVLLASLLSDAIIWTVNAKTIKNEAFVQAYQNFFVIIKDLEQIQEERERTGTDNVYLEYFFKKRKDDYNICFATSGNFQNSDEWEEIYFQNPNDWVEIYNHTIFTVEELESLEYRTNRSVRYAELSLDGRHYLVFYGGTEGLRIYRIEDITYVWENLRNLAVCMVLVTFGAAMFAIVALYLVMKQVLRPLKELNDTTKRMAENLYGQRVTVQRRDEIGQLGESFNKMAEAVESRTQSLQESEKRKTLFMGNLTHELKTPMTAISGYAQTLLYTNISREDQEEALRYIYEECNRLERLSKKMMKLLELDQEEEPELENVSVKQLFEAAEKSCRAVLTEKQMSLEWTEQGQSFPMDLDLMTDVMINLIDNGVKASAPGGRIVLRASGNALEVQDFGRGIPKEEQEKILEPFYMIDKSRSRKSGGAGLGLALTSMIVKRHHILLQIDSEEGKGTRIILQFTSAACPQ